MNQAAQVRIAIRLCLGKFWLKEDWIIERSLLTVYAWAHGLWPVECGWYFTGSYWKSEPLRAPDWNDFEESEAEYRQRIEGYIKNVKQTRRDHGIVRGKEELGRNKYEWLVYRQIYGWTAGQILERHHHRP